MNDTVIVSYLRSIFGLDGTPPGVRTLTALLRVPSPLRVKAATWKAMKRGH